MDLAMLISDVIIIHNETFFKFIEDPAFPIRNDLRTK